MNQWFPQDKNKLNNILDKFLKTDKKIKEVHGLIVPHAGYEFSGEIAGKAFGLLKDKKIEKAVVLGPSHYVGFEGVRACEKLETPLGKVKIIKNDFEKVEYEHSVENQIPFLQKLNPDIEVLPLVVGELSNGDAKKIAEKFLEIDAVYIFSTDLSHFLSYEEAVKIDKKTIEIIENLDINNFENIDACGKFPLLVLMNLCKLKNWSPKLIEYKNSGNIIDDKSSVVGYTSFYF